MKTLPRYIIREHLFPFLMGLTVFTFLLIMDKIFTLADLIVKYGVSIFTVAELLFYILPATFAITIPMACLVAVMVAFSRLKNDHEITALKASGVSLLPLLGVMALLGLAVSAGMIVFNNTLLPRFNYAYRNLYFNIVSQRAAIVVKEHVFVEDFDGYVFRVGDKDPLNGMLKNVIVIVLPKNATDPVRTILAKHGRLISDPVHHRVVLRLQDGVMQLPSKNDPLVFSQTEFSAVYLDLDINRQLISQSQDGNRNAREMSMSEIREFISKQSANGEDVNLLWVEYHKKMSIPFACLAFVLLGAPVGILAPRSGRYVAYFIGVLLIFIYYIFISLGETFGADGRLQPWLAMWLPNVLLIACGMYGIAWVARESPPFTGRFRKHFSPGGRP